MQMLIMWTASHQPIWSVGEHLWSKILGFSFLSFLWTRNPSKTIRPLGWIRLVSTNCCWRLSAQKGWKWKERCSSEQQTWKSEFCKCKPKGWRKTDIDFTLFWILFFKEIRMVVLAFLSLRFLWIFVEVFLQRSHIFSSEAEVKPAKKR